MKFYVCVKHVPDTAASIKVMGDADYDKTVKFVMNPYDEYALEEAVQQKQALGGEVVAITVGGKESVATLRSALAVGADRGILVTAGTVFLDSGKTAQALATAIEKDGGADLIFMGKQSVDTEGMQTHYRLAKTMKVPVANEVVSLTLEEGRVVVEHEVGAGDREVLELSMPCVLGATKGLNEPRYPKLPDILKAKKKPIQEMNLSDLGIADQADTATVAKLLALPERGAATMLSGSVEDMVKELIDRLSTEAEVL
ncbi:MAG: electron transfer flavoprotein subunit beta/FixA family protein [Thermodesulfobacteriota bacterium]